MNARLLCIAIAIIICSTTAVSQTPGGINYQGIARNNTFVPFDNDSLLLRFSIKEKTANGPVLYTEVRGTRTDSFGVFQVVIGGGGALSQSGDIKKVTWSDTTKKFLMVEMNPVNPIAMGYVNMGTTQLLSVPFSFYADVSDSARIAAKSDTATFANGSGRYFFSASIAANSFQSLAGLENFEERIKFPLVIQNEGNVYKPASSSFIAPDSGFYQFNISGFGMLEENEPSNSSNWQIYYTTVLMKNNNSVLKILNNYEHNYYKIVVNGQDQVTENKEGTKSFNSSVIVKLAKNDEISVRIDSGYVGFGGISLGYSSNSVSPGISIAPTAFAEFSGYKVK